MAGLGLFNNDSEHKDMFKKRNQIFYLDETKMQKNASTIKRIKFDYTEDTGVFLWNKTKSQYTSFHPVWISNSFDDFTSLEELEITCGRADMSVNHKIVGYTFFDSKILSENKFENLSSLKVNRANFYSLNDLKSGIEKLSNLKSLELRISNEILSKTFDNLNNLESLNLGGNFMKTLEKHAFSTLNNLIILDLSSNRIESIESDAFFGLKSLTHLIMSSNRIKVIGANTFSGLTNLTHLKLSRNRIRTLEPNAFFGLKKLTNLDLDGNLIDTIKSNAFFGLEKLQHLNMKGNQAKINYTNIYKYALRSQVEILK
jgi:Leucine-rich repeat (LRR) protein